MVERVVEAPFDSWHGDFRIVVYRNTIDGGEHVALVKGSPRKETPTLVRVHQFDLTADVLGWRAAHRDYVPAALRELSDYDGAAIAVFVSDPNPASISERVKGNRKAYSDTHGYRDYGIGAQILLDQGVGEMILLTSSSGKLTALEGFGLTVVAKRPLAERSVKLVAG